MKKLISSYVFDASEKKVTINDDDFTSLNQLLLITNVTRGTIIYNFASASLGGTLLNNTISLAYNTTTFSDSDILQIFIDVDQGNPVDLTELLQQGLAEIVHQLQAIRNDGGMADAAGRVRIAIESGNVGISGTVTTLTNLTNIGGQNGGLYLINGMNNAAQNLRNRITTS